MDAAGRALFETLPPDCVSVVVVEEGGEIVGEMGVMRAAHFEGVRIAPEWRGNAGVTRALLRAAWEQAAEWSGDWFLAHAEDGRVGGLLERLGGRQIPVLTYMMPAQFQEETCRQQSGCPLPLV
jgi:hypothetical protein